MGRLAAAITQAAHGGDETLLLAAVRSLPARTGRTDPRSDDDPGPIPGESFDDVTAAWIRGLLSDGQYGRAIAAAGAGSTGG